MDRAITGFHEDEEGDFVAELSCGHNQHVRHRPPFQLREWVLSEAGRGSRVGALLSCPLCDQGELPGAVRLVRSSPVWDERSIPAALCRAHRLPAGTWARIVVEKGALRFQMAGDPPLRLELGPSSPAQAVPPQVEHEVEPLGSVRFSIDFFAVQRSGDEATAHFGSSERTTRSEEGGDPSCWASSVCPECGMFLVGPKGHRPGCVARGGDGAGI